MWSTLSNKLKIWNFVSFREFMDKFMPFSIEIHCITENATVLVGTRLGQIIVLKLLIKWLFIDFGPSQQISASSVRFLPHEMLYNTFASAHLSLQQSKYFSLITLSKQMRMTIFGKLGKVHYIVLSQLPSAAKQTPINSVRNAMFPASQDNTSKLFLTWWAI